MEHTEGKGNLWLGYKAKDYDWRLSLTGKYKDVDGEKNVYDANIVDWDNAVLTSIATITNEKPLNLAARYDFNWQRPDKSAYALFAQYDHGHTKYTNLSWGTTLSLMSDDAGINGRFQDKRETSHKFSVGYHGTTRLPQHPSSNTQHPSPNTQHPNWVLNTSADVSLLKRRANDAWQRYDIYLEHLKDWTAPDTLGWEMNPDYIDYAANATLHLVNTVYSRRYSGGNASGHGNPASLLALGGGIRFKCEGERFLHDGETPNDETTASNSPVSDTILIDQRATAFRYFVEPFLNGEWRSGKWAVTADYGLRLYYMATTDKTGHAAYLYNRVVEAPTLPSPSTLHPSTITIHHFTPLVNGHAKLTYTPTKHHNLALTNTLSNQLPTNEQAVLRFVQTDEYNKVLLGNPHLKPEVRMLLSLDHTLTYGHFSATTAVSAERTDNHMEYDYYMWQAGALNEIAQVMLNVANVTTIKLSETLAWNSKWLKASAMLWTQWVHYHGIGSTYEGFTEHDNNWGWKVDGKANFGHGWFLATNFQFTGGYETITTYISRTWQSSAVSIEKRIGHITLYLNASNLINPAVRLSKYDTRGYQIYDKETRTSDRIVMLGCRWSLS